MSRTDLVSACVTSAVWSRCELVRVTGFGRGAGSPRRHKIVAFALEQNPPTAHWWAAAGDLPVAAPPPRHLFHHHLHRHQVPPGALRLWQPGVALPVDPINKSRPAHLNILDGGRTASSGRQQRGRRPHAHPTPCSLPAAPLRPSVRTCVTSNNRKPGTGNRKVNKRTHGPLRHEGSLRA